MRTVSHSTPSCGRWPRRERQRRMGLELASVDLDQADGAWLDMGASEAGDAGR